MIQLCFNNNKIITELFNIYKSDINLKAILTPIEYTVFLKDEVKHVIKYAISKRCARIAEINTQGLKTSESVIGIICDPDYMTTNEYKFIKNIIKEEIETRGGKLDEVPITSDFKTTGNPGSGPGTNIYISLLGMKEMQMNGYHETDETYIEKHRKNMKEIDGIKQKIILEREKYDPEIEITYPFLDKEVVEMYKSIHPNIKLNKNLLN